MLARESRQRACPTQNSVDPPTAADAARQHAPNQVALAGSVVAQHAPAVVLVVQRPPDPNHLANHGAPMNALRAAGRRAASCLRGDAIFAAGGSAGWRAHRGDASRGRSAAGRRFHAADRRCRGHGRRRRRRLWRWADAWRAEQRGSDRSYGPRRRKGPRLRRDAASRQPGVWEPASRAKVLRMHGRRACLVHDVLNGKGNVRGKRNERCGSRACSTLQPFTSVYECVL